MAIAPNNSLIEDQFRDTGRFNAQLTALGGMRTFTTYYIADYR
ncbi:hypothetical protein BDK88_2264 [Natrinema hispanicum]|uniref:Uncharacterized protein n=1 Tax=Natrinema hispanicum TaxID=392421 RepID=A0A482YGQ4_9EURY|nr:hypothetical protein BDK88_2264 [Natrinema hispanicum]